MSNPSEILTHAQELETVLTLRGADVFAYERSGDEAVIRFELNGMRLRLRVEMPRPADFDRTQQGNPRVPGSSAARQEYAAEVRRRWAAMRNLVKAKLDAIDANVTTFSMEFRQFEDPTALLTAGE